MRKGEIACNKHLSTSCNVFHPIRHLFFIFSVLKMSSAICFNLDQSRISSFGKELNTTALNNSSLKV